MQTLSTKLSIPPLRSRLVARTRLIEKLDQGLECGFVLVSAPAGYGKSTLLSAWLSNLESPAVWYSLDEGDNDPLRFLTYLSTALGKIEPTTGETLANALLSLPLPAIEFLLTPLVNQLDQIKTPFWLVLDDYHAIQNQLVHQAVSFLLEHRPAPLHLAIATRADPPLPLSRLRARSQMVELRLENLRLSTPEISEFLFDVMGLKLSHDELAEIETSTEGWIAGLQMAGLSLQGREDTSSFIRSFSGENRYILDYLFEEVFQRQPEEIQNFLLQTCVLGRLCAPLCDAVAGREGSQGILETLERGNLFLIPLDEQRKWYRYHHLFGDLLKSRLQHTSPDASMLLHQRASSWYAKEHDLENAIPHALAARDFENVSCLIEQIVKELDRHNKQVMLTYWLDSLPREILENRPWLCVYRAWGYYWTGRREMEEEWLQLAEKSIERTFEAGSSEWRHIQGHIAAVRALAALTTENIPRVQEMGQKALELLPEADDMRSETAIALGAAYWALGDVRQSEQAFEMGRVLGRKVGNTYAVPTTCYVGMQQVKQGRLQEAMATFLDGLRLATLPNGVETPIAGFPNERIGDLFREQNELSLAAQYLKRGVDQSVRLGQPDVLSEAYGSLGRYQLAIGDLEGAYETLQKADRAVQQAKVDPFVLCGLDDCRLKAWLADGNIEAASLWAQGSGLSLDGPLNYLHDLEHQNLARVLVAQGIFSNSRSLHEKASALLTRLHIAARKAGWVHEEIKILVLQAVNHHGCGMTEAALQSLALAVSLAEPGSYIRVFLDEGEIIFNLLSSLAMNLRSHDLTALEKSGIHFQEEQLTRLQGHVAKILSAYKQQAFQSGPKYPTTVHPGWTRNIPDSGIVQDQRVVEPLSQREMEVLNLLAQGCPDKKIAEALVIARETVHKHLKNIYGKLGVHSRTEAVARARQLGWL